MTCQHELLVLCSLFEWRTERSNDLHHVKSLLCYFLASPKWSGLAISNKAVDGINCCDWKGQELLAHFQFCSYSYRNEAKSSEQKGVELHSLQSQRNSISLITAWPSSSQKASQIDLARALSSKGLLPFLLLKCITL